MPNIYVQFQNDQKFVHSFQMTKSFSIAKYACLILERHKLCSILDYQTYQTRSNEEGKEVNEFQPTMIG